MTQQKRAAGSRNVAHVLSPPISKAAENCLTPYHHSPSNELIRKPERSSFQTNEPLLVFYYSTLKLGPHEKELNILPKYKPNHNNKIALNLP
jgi:hypothetical protein